MKRNIFVISLEMEQNEWQQPIRTRFFRLVFTPYNNECH